MHQTPIISRADESVGQQLLSRLPIGCERDHHLMRCDATGQRHTPRDLQVELVRQVDHRIASTTTDDGGRSPMSTLQVRRASAMRGSHSVSGIIEYKRVRPLQTSGSSGSDRGDFASLQHDDSNVLSAFLKRVIRSELPPKSALKLARDLRSYEVEWNVYDKILGSIYFPQNVTETGDFVMPMMAATIPRVLARWRSRASSSSSSSSDFAFAYLLEDLTCDFEHVLWMKDDHIAACLQWLAYFHGTNPQWRSNASSVPEFVTANQLWTAGTYWAFDEHQPALPAGLPETFKRLSEVFFEADRSFFSQANVLSIGQRLSDVAQRISETARGLWPRTLCHGDAKGAHFMFPRQGRDMEGRGLSTNPLTFDMLKVIDFQWCGWYSPFVDVVYFIHGTVCVEQLRNNEAHFIQLYLSFLDRVDAEKAASLRKVALSHYNTLLLQYAVVALGYFFKDATPESLRAESENVTELTHTRRTDDFKYFLQCVDRELTNFIAQH
jgi:hypothetical protein